MTASGVNAPPDEPFKMGQKVRVKSELVSGHVRLPAYARSKEGVIVGV